MSVAPNGLSIEYQLQNGGVGMAHLRFSQLPQALQLQFGYDPQKASLYEREQAVGLAELSRKRIRDDQIRTQAATSQAVFVHSSQPTVEYEYFDPKGKRPPGLGPTAIACTGRDFICRGDFDLSWTTNKDGCFVCRVEAMTIWLEYKTTIHLPHGVLAETRAHEEGHRRIDECFYALGPEAAQRAGEFLRGGQFPLKAKTLSEAEQEGQDVANNALRSAYNKVIKHLPEEPNHFYDKLCKEGVEPDKAVQEVLKHFELKLPDLPV